MITGHWEVWLVKTTKATLSAILTHVKHVILSMKAIAKLVYMSSHLCLLHIYSHFTCIIALANRKKAKARKTPPLTDAVEMALGQNPVPCM